MPDARMAMPVGINLDADAHLCFSIVGAHLWVHRYVYLCTAYMLYQFKHKVYLFRGFALKYGVCCEPSAHSFWPEDFKNVCTYNFGVRDLKVNFPRDYVECRKEQ
jgi:hypothetical protein